MNIYLPVFKVYLKPQVLKTVGVFKLRNLVNARILFFWLVHELMFFTNSRPAKLDVLRNMDGT